MFPFIPFQLTAPPPEFSRFSAFKFLNSQSDNFPLVPFQVIAAPYNEAPSLKTILLMDTLLPKTLNIDAPCSPLTIVFSEPIIFRLSALI